VGSTVTKIQTLKLWHRWLHRKR